MNLPDHLGGQWGGNIDRGMIAYLQKTFGIQSLIDIGCGDGYAAMQYADMGLSVKGVDGDWTRLPDDPRFTLHDFASGPLQPQPMDLAYSVEFLEHVESQYIPNFMPLFAACRYAVVTAAPPGQDGHHHVNCQPKDYWIEVFREWGMVFDAEATKRIKQHSTLCKAKGPRAGRAMKYFQKNGLFFSCMT